MTKHTTRSKSLGARMRLESLEDRINPVAGALDQTFGGDHKVTTPIGPASDIGRSVAIQADGKIVLAGYSHNGANYDFAVARYNLDGSLDTSFDGDGKLTTSIGSSDDVATSVAIQPDGKIVVVGKSSNGSNYDFALTRYNPNGGLDISFDGDGKLTTGIGTSNDVAYSIALQADGKIVVAGKSANGSNDDLALARYSADGSLDASFDGDGKLTTGIGSSDDVAASVAIQADGKIVTAGYSYNGSDFDVALARYNADGSFDTSFDGDGKLTTSLGSSNDFANCVAIQADGKIVVAGESFNGSNYDFGLARYNPNGSLDTSFDGDGKLTTGIGASDDVATCMAIQADGKIVGGGRYANGSNNDFALARYNADGSLDTGFDGDGRLTTAIGSSDDMAWSMAVQADGKIVIAGESANGSNTDFALVRYKADGSLDPLADGNGRLTTPIGSTTDIAYSVAIQADGRIVTAGYSANGGNIDFALSRYNPDGSLDTSFDSDGKLTTGIGSSDDVATGVAIQADGKIVVAGYSYIALKPNIALARFNPDGSLDTSFDGDGKLTTSIGTTADRAYSVAIQSDGKIVAAGWSFNGANHDFALARYNEDGSLDTSFDGDGTLSTSFGSSDDYAYSVAIQSDGKIVAAGQSPNGVYYDFALARYNEDGSLDTGFDGDGKLTTPIGTTTDIAYSVAMQTDGKIVAAGVSWNGTDYDLALARYNADGSLDTNFDSDGKLSTPIGSSNDFANSVAIQADGKIVAAGVSYAGSISDFTLVRYNADGSLDTSFDGDGKLTTAIGTGSSAANSVAIQANGKIVAAGSSRNGSNDDFALIRVRGDNHVPVAMPNTINVTEDGILSVASPTYISEPDGDTAYTTQLAGPSHGILNLTIYGTFTYMPDPNYVGPDSFLYKVKDPDGASDIGAVSISVVNDASDRLEVVSSPGITTFTESVPLPSSAMVVDPNIRVGSAFEDTITSATVKFSSGYVSKKDMLTFATIGAIKGKFDAKSGTLKLTGTAGPADYQAALRTVKYANKSAQPVDGMRTIAIQVKDTGGTGDPATRLLRVIGLNTKPTLTLPATGLTYKSRGKGLAVASTLKITDLDNSRLIGATVSIGAGFAANLDMLSVTTKSGIAANYEGATGVLTLTGNATLKDYMAMLKSLKFETPMAAPAGLRAISISVTDGLLTSDPLTRNVTIP